MTDKILITNVPALRAKYGAGFGKRDLRLTTTSPGALQFMFVKPA